MLLDCQAPIGTRPLRLADIVTPEPGPREVRVAVGACACCRTDLHVIEGDLAPRRLPLVPGHQVVGRIDAVGAGVQRFGVGDRVGIAWLRSTCGTCAYCRSGSENLCTASRYTGWDDDGGYAEAAIVHEDFAYSIPSRYADEAAAPLLCAGIIGYRALARARVPDGGRLGLWGFGSSAHLVLQLARGRQCEAYVVTRDEAHRRLAEEMGARWAGRAGEAPPVPLDGAIVFAPSGAIVPEALRAIRPGGTVALAGIHMSAIPSLDYESTLFREKVLTSVTSNTRSDGEALLEEAARIGIVPKTRTFGLAEANDALAAIAGDAVRGTAVLVP